MYKLTLHDQTLQLYPQRALFWRKGRTLVVADVHFGKTAVFRTHGIPLPAGSTDDNLGRLTAVLAQTGAERLLILGDLIHAKRGRTEQVLTAVSTWRQQFSQLHIDLVLGNHDQHAGRPPEAWGMHCHNELVERPFVWRHHPGESAEGYVLAGHVHPAVALRGGGDRVTLPCFYFGHRYGLLPSFGDFTGHGLIYPKVGETAVVIVDDELIPFGREMGA